MSIRKNLEEEIKQFITETGIKATSLSLTASGGSNCKLVSHLLSGKNIRLDGADALIRTMNQLRFNHPTAAQYELVVQFEHKQLGDHSPAQ